MMKSKFIKSGLATLITLGAAGGVTTGILVSRHQNHSIQMFTSDEEVLISDKATQEAVETYISLTN
jgi:hypothetical protein